MSLLYVYQGVGSGGDYTVALDLFESLRAMDVVNTLYAVCESGHWEDGSRHIRERAEQRGLEVRLVPGWSDLAVEVSKQGVTPTVAHIHTGADVPRLRDISAFRAEFPLLRSVWTVHGPADITEEVVNGYKLRFFLGGRLTNRIIVPSIHKLEQWQKVGVYGRRIVRIPNPIRNRSKMPKAEARAQFGLPQDKEIAVFVGLLREAKRPGDLIDACALLKEERPNLICVFAGSGLLEQELKDAAEAKGVDARFLGFVNDVTAVYSAADAFVFPSEYDNFPIALFEGISFGVPTVCSEIPPTVNELAGCPGVFRYPVGSATEMAKQICAALDSKGADAAEMNKFMSERYSADGVARQHLDLYNTLGLRGPFSAFMEKFRRRRSEEQMSSSILTSQDRKHGINNEFR